MDRALPKHELEAYYKTKKCERVHTPGRRQGNEGELPLNTKETATLAGRTKTERECL